MAGVESCRLCDKWDHVVISIGYVLKQIVWKTPLSCSWDHQSTAHLTLCKLWGMHKKQASFHFYRNELFINKLSVWYARSHCYMKFEIKQEGLYFFFSLLEYRYWKSIGIKRQLEEPWSTVNQISECGERVEKRGHYLLTLQQYVRNIVNQLNAPRRSNPSLTAQNETAWKLFSRKKQISKKYRNQVHVIT